HSARTPAAFMTAAHLSRSAARNAANSSGEEFLAPTPSLTKVLAISGDCRLALMAALSRSTIAPGVPAGAPPPGTAHGGRVGDARFDHRRHIGHLRAAPVAGRGQRPDPTGLD